MTRLSQQLLLTIVYLATETYGYQHFQTYIPNGNRVPNPCNPEDLWPGVGHKLVGGTKERNPFGLAFAANNQVWTKELCQQDSDGDLKTNGEELGDPECTWTPNAVPKFTTNLSHPGICEPLDSPTCRIKNDWLECPKDFSCPDFELSTTKFLNMTIPKTAVPPQETTYMCFGFKMPNDTKYHAIGTIPKIDNKQVMHHMLLYGCTHPPTEEMMTTGVECTMGVPGCQTIIGLWGVGTYGECHPEEYGFPIGVSGFQYTLLQMHWNNPGLVSGMTDSSGMEFYYTDVLRKNDAMVIMTGQNYLEIPPKQPSVTFQGTCTAACSNLIEPPSVHISASILHMHLLGKSGSIEVLRDGKLHSLLVNQTTYDYNTPLTNSHQPPIEFKAGDEIRVTCEYQSMTTNKTVYYGEGTQDEMCFGFVTIYPAVVGFDFCGQYSDLKTCSMPNFNFFEVNDCKIQDFVTLLDPIFNTCTPGNCSEACVELMTDLQKTGCLTDLLWQDIRDYQIPNIPNVNATAVISAIEGCWPTPATSPPNPENGSSSIVPSQNTLFVLLLGVFMSVLRF